MENNRHHKKKDLLSADGIPILFPANRTRGQLTTFQKFEEALKGKVLSEIPLAYPVIQKGVHPKFTDTINLNFFQNYWPYLTDEEKLQVTEHGLSNVEIVVLNNRYQDFERKDTIAKKNRRDETLIRN